MEGGTMTDEELIRDFEAGVEPAGGFHHAQHVRVAWWYLVRFQLPDALGRFTGQLKRFATARGSPGLYHETITVAFVLIINDRLDVTGRSAGWEEFARAHPDLLEWKPSVLDRYYHAETLASARAKRVFVMPDRL
jgi:hypothetical protein